MDATASRASPCPVSKCRPIATASFGFILRRTTRRVSCPRSICSKAASRRPRVRRLVLIGTSAAGLLDLKTTPNDPVMPGVEVHAQVLEKHPDQLHAVGAELRHRRSWRGASARRRDHRAGADLRPLAAAVRRAFIALLVGTSWYLFTEQS
jgi:pimeloyl-ACP methyl ester carboxylesterase